MNHIRIIHKRLWTRHQNIVFQQNISQNTQVRMKILHMGLMKPQNCFCTTNWGQMSLVLNWTHLCNKCIFSRVESSSINFHEKLSMNFCTLLMFDKGQKAFLFLFLFLGVYFDFLGISTCFQAFYCISLLVWSFEAFHVLTTWNFQGFR